MVWQCMVVGLPSVPNVAYHNTLYSVVRYIQCMVLGLRTVAVVGQGVAEQRSWRSVTLNALSRVHAGCPWLYSGYWRGITRTRYALFGCFLATGVRLNPWADCILVAHGTVAPPQAKGGSLTGERGCRMLASWLPMARQAANKRVTVVAHGLLCGTVVAHGLLCSSLSGMSQLRGEMARMSHEPSIRMSHLSGMSQLHASGPGRAGQRGVLFRLGMARLVPHGLAGPSRA
jgi:hypothetical protein